jgi:hypothetical protein
MALVLAERLTTATEHKCPLAVAAPHLLFGVRLSAAPPRTCGQSANLDGRHNGDHHHENESRNESVAEGMWSDESVGVLGNDRRVLERFRLLRDRTDAQNH